MSLSRMKSDDTPRSGPRARTTDNAASIDSFITSPSLPVRMTLPLPGIRTASMDSKSPPDSVHAKPTTWPIFGSSKAVP